MIMCVTDPQIILPNTNIGTEQSDSGSGNHANQSILPLCPQGSWKVPRENFDRDHAVDHTCIVVLVRHIVVSHLHTKSGIISREP